MASISKERADEIDAAWQAASMTERLSLQRCQWFAADTTTYYELPPTELERYAAKRIAELEELVERGLRFAETCEWDKLEPPSFRARAEVWIADARFALTQPK